MSAPVVKAGRDRIGRLSKELVSKHNGEVL